MARQEKAPRNKYGELAAIKAGGWKIRRSDLEQLVQTFFEAGGRVGMVRSQPLGLFPQFDDAFFPR